eukprot:1181122-Prorocentrum_minimum.AAC.2
MRTYAARCTLTTRLGSMARSIQRRQAGRPPARSLSLSSSCSFSNSSIILRTSGSDRSTPISFAFACVGKT